MDERNCGFCMPCARGDYDECETFPKKLNKSLEDEIAALKQELQTLREQKPFQTKKDGNVWSTHGIDPASLPNGTKLYLAPMPAREGWKLVPIEPTDEMLRAQCEDGLNWYSIAGEIYKAMLEAAPKESL